MGIEVSGQPSGFLGIQGGHGKRRDPCPGSPLLPHAVPSQARVIGTRYLFEYAQNMEDAHGRFPLFHVRH